MDAPRSEHEQAVLWNGVAGRGWVEMQTLLDRMFKPFEERLAQAVAARPGGRVLDVGCGTGSTTLAAARALGPESHCVGIDISEPMIAAAQARAAREGSAASFLRADAQFHAFEAASVDLIISRFGVMFFEDSVQAFTNLRRAARDGAGLQLIVWRGPAENPFMTTAERAAAPLLPNLPPRLPNAPGQFAFADPQRVSRIVKESGWTGIDIQPLDVTCILPEKELVGYLTRLGPLGRVLPEVGEQTRTQVIKTVRAAFEPYVYGDEVRFNAACWVVAAQALAGGNEGGGQ